MQVRNASFAANGDINCQIDHPIFGWSPFTASSDDPEEHGREIFDRLKDIAAEYVAPPPDIDALSQAARDHRAALLAQSDWTQVPDAPVDQVAWAVYRQALRDLPDQPEFPLTIDWPVPPST